MRIALRSVALGMVRPQLVGARALLEALDTYSANGPFRAMRPLGRPAAGAAREGTRSITAHDGALRPS